MSPNPNDDYLERVKAEIRAEAAIARTRDPLPRHEPPARAAANDGIERDRLDYAIGELTGDHYVAFIDHAFRALLKRPPDDAGAATQLRLLAAGASKAEILGNLRWSPEGKRIGACVRGLLPRYAMAKLARAPGIGYAIEWSFALAGLPLLLRHQRAADTTIAARFNVAADAQRDHAQRLDSLKVEVASAHAGIAALGAEHDRRSEVLRTDIRRTSLRVDGSENELAQLRHYVHTANHWIASLQRSLAELEVFADDERERADRLTAAVSEPEHEAVARNARHAIWSAEFARRLPAGARVLDLGSGDGTWLGALRARGVAASGIEANRALAVRAQARGEQLAPGDPLAALTRCADASLGGVSVAASLIASVAMAAELFEHALRVLAVDGWLLLRVEREPYRFGEGASAREAPHWIALLDAAGFAPVAPLDIDGAYALLAQRR